MEKWNVRGDLKEMQTFNLLEEREGHLRLEKHQQKSGKIKDIYKDKKPIPRGPVNKKLECLYYLELGLHITNCFRDFHILRLLVGQVQSSSSGEGLPDTSPGSFRFPFDLW